MNTPRSSSPVRRSARRGFTLIEVLGVMMILGLITMALVPALLKEFDRQARDRETKNVERLADGLVQYITRTRTIPAATAFYSAIATQLGLHTNEVLFNDRGQRRVFLIDPTVTNAIAIPYTQTYFGASNNLGTALGAVIISSVGGPLPATLTSGFTTNATVFQAIWNAADGTIPSSLAWSGDGNDLRIQRINFSTLFVPLILNYDTATAAAAGRYTIDASTTNVLPTQPIFTSSFIKGTVLGLHDDASLGGTNTMEAREVLQHPMSYIYQGASWRGSLFQSVSSTTTPTTGTDLQSSTDTFSSSPQNSNAEGNPQTTTTTVVTTITQFMTNYIDWANNGFPNTGTLANTITNTQQRLDDVTEDIHHHPDVDDDDNDPDCDSCGHGHSHDDCDHSHGSCNHDGRDHSDCNHRRHCCRHDGRDHSHCCHHRGWCNHDGRSHGSCNHTTTTYGHCDSDDNDHSQCHHSRGSCNHDGHSHAGCNHSRNVCVWDGNNHGSCNHGSGWCNNDGNSHWSCSHSSGQCNYRDSSCKGYSSNRAVGCRTRWGRGRH